MAFDQAQVFDYIATADCWIQLNDSLGEINIHNLIEPLIESINGEGGVSYVIGEKKRYRSSTLATVLDALADVKLLPLDAVHQMQDHLYFLRDNFVPLDPAEDDVITKNPEDSPAWGIDEKPSVWTTSRAIIALMNTNYVTRDGFPSTIRPQLRNSVYWLAGQAYTDGGWGYQHYSGSESCKSNVPMTALAMKAILLAQADPYLFNEDARRDRKFNIIANALRRGKDFLLSMKKVDENGQIFWGYRDKPGVAISMWALDSLMLLSQSQIQGFTEEDYNEIEPSVLKYVYANFPTKDTLDSYCQSEMFFLATKNEGGLKYKTDLSADKRFYTFKPYIVSSLLDRGEDPLNPQIVQMIKWLLQNRERHWVIEEYNSSSPCSISAAMAINVIVKWLQKVSERSFSRTVGLLINNAAENENCQYGLPCDQRIISAPNTPEAPTVKSAAIKVIKKLFYIVLWGASVIVTALLLTSSLPQELIAFFCGQTTPIIIGVIGSLVATWLCGRWSKLKMIASSIKRFFDGH